MPAVVVLLGLVAAAVAAVLMWYWIRAWERVMVAKALAGGDERAKAIEGLDERLAGIERFMRGEDYAPGITLMTPQEYIDKTPQRRQIRKER